MPDDKTWTWDDLAKSSAQVTAKLGSKGVYGFDRFGVGAAELGAWARQHGEEVWPTEGNRRQRSHHHELLRLRQQADRDEGHAQAEVQVENTTARSDASLFATNKAAFHLLFHTQISAFGAASGTEMKLLRLPAQETGESPKMVNKASMYWSISARGEHTEAAAKLVDFLMTDPAATKVLTTERGIPAIPAVQKTVAPLLDPQAKVALEFSRAIAPELVPHRLRSPRPTPPASPSSSPIGTDVLFGRTSSADAATKTLSIIQSMK